MAQWVDFKELRRRLDFRQLLEHYSVEYRAKKGEQVQAFCPLPTHEGKKRSRSFSANLKRGIWQCFGCGARGNVLDFAARMEGFDPNNRQQLREAAIQIERKFCDGSAPPTPSGGSAAAQDGEPAAPESEAPEPEPDSEAEVVANAPLDFELKGLDPQHPYLKERGLTRETIEHFGLGYCSRGVMKGRIAIPIHNPGGQLVGYAGRITDDSAIGPDTPKYLFPAKRERHGVTYEFRKSELLFNVHRLRAPVADLVVVEGFFDVFWLWQNGYRDTVALMGTDCSEQQLRLLDAVMQATGRVWLMPDGDEAGSRCAHDSLPAIARCRHVRWVALSEGAQPTDLNARAIATCLHN